jgi:hypothetical protein
MYWDLNKKFSKMLEIISFKYSGPSGYDRLDIRPTWVTTKTFILTYDQISSYDPRQRKRDEHISDITCTSLRALSVFALFCRRDHINSSYQSMYSINKYRVTEKGYVSLTARSGINQALRPTWRSKLQSEARYACLWT